MSSNRTVRVTVIPNTEEQWRNKIGKRITSIKENGVEGLPLFLNASGPIKSVWLLTTDYGDGDIVKTVHVVIKNGCVLGLEKVPWQKSLRIEFDDGQVMEFNYSIYVAHSAEFTPEEYQ